MIMDSNILDFMTFVNTVLTFSKSLWGMIAAVAAIFYSLALFIIEVLRSRKNNQNEERNMKGSESNNKTYVRLRTSINCVKKFAQIVSIILFMIFGAGILRLNHAAEPLPPNVRMTNEAWKAYNDKKYEQAIKKAEECIKDFERDAIPEQQELQRNNIALPPIGRVSAKDKKTIFSHGLLNDVATCWFIKGISLENLGRTQEAIRAYCKAAQFTYARTYDPSWDGFWSPSKKASNSISYLNGRCE